MPPWVKPVGVAVVFLSLVPFAVIARARVHPTPDPRIHIIRDMDNQMYFKGQSANPLFADGRAMRPPVPGTVARGEDELDDHLYRGVGADGAFLDAFPEQAPATPALLERGRERYTIYCAPCHGHTGYGDGMITRRANELRGRGVADIEWVQPTSYHTPNMKDYPVGQLFHVITNGVRNMPPYGAQVPVRDRWAIAAYVKALQQSQTEQ